MRIALITPEFITDDKFDGGLANYTYRLAVSLTELGHEAVVVVKGKEEKTFKMEGFEVRYVSVNQREMLSFAQRVKRKLLGNTESKTPLFDTLQRNSFLVNEKLQEWHKEIPFDLLHYAHLGGLGFFCPATIPSVIRISSSTRLCHERGGYGQTDDEMEQQEKIENGAMQKVSAVFGPSRMIANYIGKQINREIEIIETPFKLNTGNWDDSIYKSELEGKKYCLFYGSLAQLKGVETIARCLKDFLLKNPEVHFVFVGKVFEASNGQPMNEYLKTSADEAADRVHITGRLKHEQLYPIIQNAAAVVLPSLVDNFPNTCIESMALKRIVVGTEKNGFEQLIDHEKSGFLIEINNHSQLLSVMNKIMNLTDEERAKIGETAAKRITDLEPEKVVNQLICYYQQVIDKA